MRTRAALILAVFLPSLTASAIDPENAAADYARLQKWQFSSAVPLPPEGRTLQRENATWILESGTVRLLEPLSDGTITGFVFEGRGRFRMSIPDRYELAQLRRFTNRHTLEEIDQPITHLVLRTSDTALIDQLPEALDGHSQCPMATKRHESWFVNLRNDADARVLSAVLNPGSVYTLASARTKDFDWLTWEYDSARDEEISLTHFYARLPEVWVSVDRADQRLPDGRPGPGGDSALASLDHVDVKADLTLNSRAGRASRHQQRPIDGKYVVEHTFTGLAPSVGALRLGLWSRARNVKAFDENGRELTLFRDNIGRRAAKIDDRIHDDDFVVVLGSRLDRGQRVRIRFEYELETANYAPGSLWYPVFREAVYQKHTARLELTVRKQNELRSMGRLESRTEDERGETTVWLVDRPTAMVTFSTATRFEEVRVTAEGVPTVIAFGPDFQFGTRQKAWNVGADVANSLLFFQNLFGDRVEAEQLYVTSVAGNHGQAFEGFLHMGEFTFASERAGASELFRAHEVAHEWWGHKIGFRSYRDQWISEAFAEYCAMMFVRQTVRGGEAFFDEILRSYEGVVKGNFAGGYSKFNRPWLIERNVAERNRLGPIGHGRRAVTRDMPFGYTIQTYHKGPLVLHMLRMLLRYTTGSDEMFFDVLREFVREQKGQRAATEDFRRILERRTNNDWSWFFDAWIYRAEIPSYVWRHEVKAVSEGFALTISLDRRDVTDGFSVVIPIRADLENGKSVTFYVTNRDSQQTVTHILPARPKRVVFAPDNSLLASIRRD